MQKIQFRKMARASVYLLLFALLVSQCAEKTDESQFTEELYAQAVESAKKNEQKVLLVFGADWCGDCLYLKERFLENEEMASLLAENYLVMHVDVGRFDRNLGFAEKFGSPEKKGIPALVVVDPSNNEKVLGSTKGGEFSSARKMQDEAILSYLRKFL